MDAAGRGGDGGAEEGDGLCGGWGGGERVRVISEITYEVSVDESHQSVKVSEWHFF